MTKNQRQMAILDSIENMDIHTQFDLANQMRNRGFDVTQATISRDINELQLIKISDGNNGHKYATSDKAVDKLSARKIRIFYESVLSIKRSGNIIIINTIAGSANAAGETVDSLQWSEIIGTIAGDNCIMVILGEGADGDEICTRFGNLLS